MAAKITGGGCPWQRFYRKRTPSRYLLFSVPSSHSMDDMDTVYKQLGLFSLKKKIKDVVLKAEMLAPNVLELEEEQWIKQEEKMPYYGLWDDPTKTYEILLKIADSLKDLKYKDEEAKLIIQLGEIDYSLFEQSYDVSRSLHHYEMLKLLNYLYDVEGACVIIKSGSQDTKSQVNFTIIKIWTEQVVSLYIKCAEKQVELKDEDMIVSYPAKENHKLAAGERNRFPSQLIAFSRHKRPFLLRATPTSTTVEVSDAVSGAPSKLISQTRSPEWWIDSLRSKVRSNLLREAVLTYIDMISLGIKPDNFAFPALLKAVADLEDMDLGKQVHAHVHKFGYGVDSVTVANTLVNLYRKCGDFGAVYKVFDRISDRNQVSWNSMISSLCSFEKWQMALEAFRCMLDENVEPSSFTLVSVALACSNLPVPEGLMLGMQVHAYSLRKGDLNSYIVNTLVAMYGKLGKLASSKILLGTFEGRDLVTWNTVLSSLCQNEQFLEALEYLREMVLKGVEPDGFTISSVLPVCSHLEMLRTGKEIHAYALKNGSLDENSFVGSALVDMYCNCKQVLSGRRVFDGIFDRKIGLWNAMITGYAQNEHDEEALALFIEMEESAGLQANTTTMASVVPACVRSNAFSRKEAIHGFVMKRGLGGDRFVQNALMDMYSRLGKIDIAEMIFGKMEDRDLVTWNTMITGYVFSESHEEALRLLHKMQNFKRKASEGVTRVGLKPNSITLMTILPSCAALSALAKGKEIHAYAIKNNLATDVAVGSALVDMYAKCGCLHMSRKVFDRIPNKNVITWNVIIMAYGMHGNGLDAIDLLKMMMVQKVKPNEVTFISVFAACSHSGMVDEGLRIFYNMKKDYGVEPSSDHYACVVDLFGRAGRVNDAYQLMNTMPLDIDKAGAWSSLLGACRIHNNLEIGEIAAQNLIQSGPNVASHYVLLANMYSSAGLWDKAKEVRRKMKEKGVRKEPGCSWIEYGDEVHKFIAGDSSHPQSAKLHGYLESLWEKMRKEGYVPDTSCVLHNVEEDEKEVLLCGHSEKLAIAFGILNTSPGTVIRVAKNLRVCNDCHLATKFISKIVDREIILRDVRRFHHFKNGTCSCGDYW